ncbi:tetratricopeptide repeat protein [Chlamydiota bacterium]
MRLKQHPFYSKREFFFGAILFLLALLIRFIFLIQVKQAPFFGPFSPDEFWYDKLAWESLYQGSIPRVAYFINPGYIHFLSVIYTLLYRETELVVIIQILLDSMSVVLLYYLCCKLFNKRVAIIAGIGALLYACSIFYTGHLLATTLGMFLSVFGMVLLVIKKDTILFALGRGVVWGTACLVRPNFFLFIGFILLWFYLNRMDKKITSFFKTCFLFLMGFLLPIFPILFHNYMTENSFLVTSSQGGFTFYIGNNADANGYYKTPPLFDNPYNQYFFANYLAKKELKRKITSSEVSGYWYQKGLLFIKKDPGRFLWLSGKKIQLFFQKTEWPINSNYYFRKEFIPLLQLPLVQFGIVCPFALFGMFLLCKQWKKYFLLFTFIGSIFLTNILFFVSSRLRMPAIPFFMCFASYGVYYLVQKGMQKKIKELLICLVALVPVVWFVNYPTKSDSLKASHSSLNNLGVAYLQSNQLDKAKSIFVEMRKEEGSSIVSYYNMGSVYFKQADFPKALKEFSAAVTCNPWMVDAYYNRGLCYEKLGMAKEAIAEYEKVLSLHAYERIYSLIAAIYYKQGDFVTAKKYILKGLSIYPGDKHLLGLFDKINKKRQKKIKTNSSYKKQTSS